MSNNIRETRLIPVSIQSGNGVPTHISPIGTLYFDNIGGDEYINKDGVIHWSMVFDSDNATSFTGGTVSGATYFPYGLTATTISATTYQNLPLDIHVTGFTFNTGNYNITINQNDGSSYTQNLSILASDMTVTGGTYNSTTGIATFTNNTGGTFNVSGFLTGHTDTYVTAMTFTNNVLTLYQTQGNLSVSQLINNLSGLTVNGTITANTVSATTYQNLPSNVITTGGTYSAGSASFTNSTGGTFTVTGFYTGYTPNTDIFTTGATYNNNVFTFTNNSGGTFNVLFNTVSGLTVNGGLSATTISAATYYSGSTLLQNAILNNTGVSATTYGSSSAIPIITVQSDGRILSASTAPITIPPATGSNLYLFYNY